MSAETNGHTRISISLDTLRTEVRLANAELELRLKESLASKIDLDGLRREHAALVVVVTALEQNVRLKDERVETTRATLAEETERRRVVLADTALTGNVKFTKRQQIAALFLSVAALGLTVLGLYLATR